MTTTSELEELLRDRIEKHRVPGAVIAVLENDQVTQAAAGVLNVETGVEATVDSVFQIGSTTKSYTATLIMQLIDEGAFELDTPVVKLLPDFKVADPEVTENVTVRHLLAHTSGIQGDHFIDTGRGDDCIERYVETCAELGQNHPLGATMSYCNSGYVVLGRIIEVQLGVSWDEAVRTKLAEPLGLSSTVTLPEEAIRYRVAYGHMFETNEAPKLAPAWMLPRSCGPAGLICSTVGDVIEFARMHLRDGVAGDGKQVLSPASVKAMQQEEIAIPDPYTLGSHWGAGWILFDWDGRRLFGHDGATIGQSTFLRILPDSDLAIALVTNGGSTHDLFLDIYGELLKDLADLEVPVMPTPLDDPPALELDRYTGTYERVAVETEIVEREGKLVAITTTTGMIAELLPEASEEHVLLPAGEDLFVVKDEDTGSCTPFVFFDLPDGTRCIHMGARATPRTS